VWRWIQGLAYRSNERESSNSVNAAVVARVKGPQPVQLTALWARKVFFRTFVFIYCNCAFGSLFFAELRCAVSRPRPRRPPLLCLRYPRSPLRLHCPPAANRLNSPFQAASSSFVCQTHGLNVPSSGASLAAYLHHFAVGGTHEVNRSVAGFLSLATGKLQVIQPSLKRQTRQHASRSHI
jgi:hypothetical protein